MQHQSSMILFTLASETLPCHASAMPALCENASSASSVLAWPGLAWQVWSCLHCHWQLCHTMLILCWVGFVFRVNAGLAVATELVRTRQHSNGLSVSIFNSHKVKTTSYIMDCLAPIKIEIFIKHTWYVSVCLYMYLDDQDAVDVEMPWIVHYDVLLVKHSSRQRPLPTAWAVLQSSWFLHCSSINFKLSV